MTEAEFLAVRESEGDLCEDYFAPAPEPDWDEFYHDPDDTYSTLKY